VPRDFKRTDRLAELMQRELAQMIQREVKDPRLDMVTISGVEVTRDLSHAKVYVTVLASDDAVKQNIAILNKAKGFLRSQLGKRIKIRTIPELEFVYDSSIKEGTRLSSLIDAAIAQDEQLSDEPPDPAHEQEDKS
jgi:ribosome-binding factor A